MKIDLFSVPIFINNIDVSKIELKFSSLEKTWVSETQSSYNTKNNLNEESLNYLLNVIYGTINEFIKQKFKLQLLSIWENHYLNNDFQEIHIHPFSDFSFVIYKKIEESKTIFLRPNWSNIQIFYENSILKNYFYTKYQPNLRQNQILIFPSFLEHMVPKISNSVTISGNLKIIQD